MCSSYVKLGRGACAYTSYSDQSYKYTAALDFYPLSLLLDVHMLGVNISLTSFVWCTSCALSVYPLCRSYTPFVYILHMYLLCTSCVHLVYILCTSYVHLMYILRILCAYIFCTLTQLVCKSQRERG